MLDYFDVLGMLSTDERQVQSSAGDFLESEVRPDISEQWEAGEFPRELVPKLGEMGYLGANLPRERGASGVNSIAYGLIMYELERVDSGLRSFASVQGALVMYPILRFGSREQKEAYLRRVDRISSD